MKKKIVYTDAPSDIDFASMKRIKPIPIGLPSPAKVSALINKRSRKVTITIDQSSVDFFWKQASLHNTKYQTLIKTLLSEYVKQSQSASHI